MTTESICEFGKIVSEMGISLNREKATDYQKGLADGSEDCRNCILHRIGRLLPMRARMGADGEPFDLSAEDAASIDAYWKGEGGRDASGHILSWVDSEGKNYGPYPRFDFEAGIQYVVLVPHVP